MPLHGASRSLARAARVTDLHRRFAPARALEVGLVATLFALAGCGSGLRSLTTGAATTTTSISSLTVGRPTATADHAAAADDRSAVTATTAGQAIASPGENGGEECGAIDGPGGRFVVTSEDHLRCVEALGLFRELFAGRGEKHRGVDEAETYTEVDGWSCGSGAGGFGCERSGARIEAHAEG
jgi:hypothetical protein